MWQIKEFVKIGNNIKVIYTRNKKDDKVNDIQEEKELVWNYDENRFKDYDTFEQMVEKEANLQLSYMNNR